MSSKRKVWVIPLGDPVTRSEDYPVPELEPAEARRRLGLSEVDTTGRTSTKTSKIAKITKASKIKSSPTPRRKTRRYVTRWNPWFALALTFFLGPLSLLLRMGEERTWRLAALGCGIIAAAAAWFRPGILEVLLKGPLAVLGFGAVLCVVVLLIFSTWSRAVLLAGRDIYANPHRLPQWIYTPAAIGVVGLMVPGSGLLLAGHMKRAAAALWAPILVGISTLLLMSAPEVWNRHQQLRGDGTFNSALEAFFLVAVAAGMLGLISWVVQALDGLRVALAWRNQKAPARRSDWVAAALLASMLALIITANPSDLARNLDDLVVSSQEAGLRVIPLGLGQAAMRLDSSHPVYAMHVAGLYEDLGQHQAATNLMRKLRARWLPYEQMMASGGMKITVAPEERFNLVGSPANGMPFQPVTLD